jgi:hypothetical protein
MVVLQNERLGVVELGAVVTHRLSVGRFATGFEKSTDGSRRIF